MTAQRFSDLHCSLDGRSWTNPITNATFLAEVKLEQSLKSLFMTGDTPPDVQLAFFHEAMHHWCFLSPVGSTLAFLQLRAYRRAYKLHRDKAASDDEKTALLEDLIRYTTASSLMRPFAEGLALFAQFDAGFWLSKTSAAVSDLNEWANFFFDAQGIDRERISDFPFVPPVRLIGTRLSQQAVESKAGLLCNPLTCANGGYLPGYLLVKSLWSRARAQCHERFKVSDLFLAYLRSFIYDDYGFVAVLLDPFTQEYETANAITTYFSKRFQQFMKSNLEADVERFEKAVLEKEKYRSGKSVGDVLDSGLLRLCTDAEADKSGRESLLDMIDEMDRYYSDPSDNFLHAMNRAALFQRDIMRVGSLPLSVSIAKTGDTTEPSSFHETSQEIVLSSNGKVLLRLPVPADAVQKELLMGCEYYTAALEIMMPYAGLGGRG